MQVLKYLLVMSYILFSQTVYADDIKSMYKTSCLPEMKEFRAESLLVSKNDNDAEWENVKKTYNLEELDVEVGGEQPAPREERCVLDGVEYRMKFIQRRQRYFLNYYKLAVQLFAGNKYLGVLYPMGNGTDGNLDTVGIKNGKIFVQGCAYEGADNRYCKYDYREIDFPGETSYELSLLDDDKVVEQTYNALEFNCYDKLENPFGKVNVRSYSERTIFAPNYYWLKEEPVFRCGEVEMAFAANGDVSVSRKGRFFSKFNLSNCNKQIFEIKFPLDMYMSVSLVYFLKDKFYWRGNYCNEGEDCLKCEMFKDSAE